MGTRHLICVVVDGQFKVAQYGQWDGYPEGQGYRILGFLRNCDLNAFRDLVLEVTEVTESELTEMWASVGVDGEHVTDEEANAFKGKYPWMSRDCGAGILDLIASGECRSVRLNVKFAEDRLFCEWAYVIDLDANVLEVYSSRLSFSIGGKHHLPLPLVGRWAFAELPENAAFLDALTEKEEV